MKHIGCVFWKRGCKVSSKILVTGGAGYIGSHTVRKLINDGYDILVYDNFSTGHKSLIKGVPFIDGDLGDKEKLCKTMKDNHIDAVIHFAASTEVGESVANPRKYYENNLLNGLHLLNAMVELNINKIVFSSSCATFGEPDKIPIDENEKQWPINPYGWTKFMFERILHDYDAAYGLKSVCLRYFNAAGADPHGDIGEMHEPETHVVPILLQVAMGVRESFSIFGTDYDTPDGSCIRDYVHVLDLADAHEKAIAYLNNHQKSNCFNLGTGNGVSVLELIETVESVTGRKLNIIEKERRPGDPDQLIANSKKAQEILGWRPIHSDVCNIIKTAWEWQRKGLHDV